MIRRLIAYLTALLLLLPSPAWASTPSPCDVSQLQSDLPPGVTLELASCVDDIPMYRYVKSDGTEVQDGEEFNWTTDDPLNPGQQMNVSWVLEPSIQDYPIEDYNFQDPSTLPNGNDDQQVVAKGSLNGGILSEVAIFLDGATNEFYAQILGNTILADRVMATFPLGDLGLTFPSGAPGSFVPDLQFAGFYQVDDAVDRETHLAVYNAQVGDFIDIELEAANGTWQVKNSTTTSLTGTVSTWWNIKLAGSANMESDGIRDSVLAIDTGSRDIYLIDPTNPTAFNSVDVGASILPTPWGQSWNSWDTAMVMDVDKDGRRDDVILGYAVNEGSDTRMYFRAFILELDVSGSLTLENTYDGSTLFTGNKASNFRAFASADKNDIGLLTKKVSGSQNNMFFINFYVDNGALEISKMVFPAI